uniref:TNF alpha induced protein 2 n=1 Tax=Molossus molossus TaxID=27622 RepID=A0A7J8K3C9_MOLMO|nr:TNF alpha induced protein 2 [Molossus molossus]
MLKMMTFQGLAGQRPMPGAPDFPGSPQKLRSTSEVESEASMSETSSEDLVPPLEAEVAQERDEEDASKKKKPKGLASMFSIFTKGKKKKGQPSSAEPEDKRESRPGLGGPLPTVEELKADLDCGRLEAAEPLMALERELQAMAAAGGASVKEYIVRLSKRRLVLKTAEQQQQLARQVLANANLIQHFCTQSGSPATWLHQALPKLAEIIRLQDPSAIKIEVATYATWYPDFSKGHLSAILAIKGNLSSSEVKSIRSILDVNTGPHESFKSLFSLIKVG